MAIHALCALALQLVHKYRLHVHVSVYLLSPIYSSLLLLPLLLALKFMVFVVAVATILVWRMSLVFDCTPGLVVPSGCWLDCVIGVIDLGVASVLLAPRAFLVASLLASLSLGLAVPLMFVIR